MRAEWAQLPDRVREAILERTGMIGSIQNARNGSNADLAAVVEGTSGRVFVKAAPTMSPEEDGKQVRALRRETAINPCVPEFAPQLSWTVEVEGWFAVGFEYIEGRPANYSPGSPDLAVLAETLHQLQVTPCPAAVVMRVERRWETFAYDVSPIGGNALLHTDLNPHNLLITADGRAFVVDWAFASRGASWVEVGQVIPWLIHAGHSPAEAERWAAQFPSWEDADPSHIDLYSQLSAERWSRINASHSEPQFSTNLSHALRWTAHRQATTNKRPV